MLTFKHSGKLGDIIWSLPFIRHVGGGDLQLAVGVSEAPGAASWISNEGFEFIRPLLEAQSYVHSVGLYQGEPVDYNLDDFRKVAFSSGCNLVDAFYLAFDVEPDPTNHFEPWLDALGLLPRPRKRVVVSRSPRSLGNRAIDNRLYHHLVRQNLEKHGLFVGLSDEHAHFQQLFGVNVELSITNDAHDIAKILNSADLWVGSHGLGNCIAEGLKKTSILEFNDTPSLDRFWCAFRRPNLIYI
jgi:hypothetical protein